MSNACFTSVKATYEQQTLSIEFYLSSEMTTCSYGWAYSQVLFCTTIGQWQGAFWKVHNEFPCFLILLHVVSKLHALRYHFKVSLTHQGLVANSVLHLLLPGEQSCEKAGVHAAELFRAPNRRSAEREGREIEMTKSYRCLENQKANVGTAKESR